MAPYISKLPEVDLNPRFLGFKCVVCGREHPRDHADHVCVDCGIDGILDVIFDLPRIKKNWTERSAGTDFPAAGGGGMWRFGPLLPVQPQGPHPAWNVGASPLHPAPRLAETLGVSGLWLKDDTCLPSASLKDRAAAMAVAHARHTGQEVLACASTGNAAASLAVLAARAGFTSHIFVPADAPEAKLAQLLVHGSHVVRVDGNYDQAFDLSLEEIRRHRWYSRNCAHNPLLVEGKKTAALEMARELTSGFSRVPRRWPDAVMVPVGDGCIVSSVAKAFTELDEMDLIPSVPRIIGVQAEGAAPLAAAWAACPEPGALSGKEILAAVKPMQPRTLADSISVGIPRNRVKAWRRVAATGGAFLAVPDQEIVRAIRLLATEAGVFAEPSGAAGLAGIGPALAAGLIDSQSVVAVMVTGHGLKDPRAALADIKLPDPVPPSGE
jgi:threonine synthase